MSTAQSRVENFQHVSIRDIKLGMFVVAVTKPKNDIHFKPGLISSEATFRALRSIGVEEVRIDLSRSKHQTEALLENPESNLAPFFYLK